MNCIDWFPTRLKLALECSGTSLKRISFKEDTSLSKSLQSGHSKADTFLKRELFPGPARLFLPEFTSIKRKKKYFRQRIKNSLFYCFYFFFSSKNLFTTHPCSLIIKLTLFDTQATAFSWPLTWYLHGMSNP